MSTPVDQDAFREAIYDMDAVLSAQISAAIVREARELFGPERRTGAGELYFGADGPMTHEAFARWIGFEAEMYEHLQSQQRFWPKARLTPRHPGFDAARTSIDHLLSMWDDLRWSFEE